MEPPVEAFRGSGAGAAVDTDGGAEEEDDEDEVGRPDSSGNGEWFASMLGHVCEEGLAKGSEAYGGGGMFMLKGDSIGMTGGGP